jgi:hypothetical protein
MRNTTDPISIFSSDSVLQAEFTAATNDIITSAAHGLLEGDLIWVASGTTLPAGLSASTDYYVISPTTDTFKVSTTRGGTAVDITDTGTGTHTYYLKGKSILVRDFRHNVVAVDFSSTPTMTIKFQGSNQLAAPDFNAAQAATNSWDYIEVVDLESGSAIDGDTGVACAGTADHRVFELNTNGINWVSVIITSWTAGLLKVSLTSYND